MLAGFDEATGVTKYVDLLGYLFPTPLTDNEEADEMMMMMMMMVMMMMMLLMMMMIDD